MLRRRLRLPVAAGASLLIAASAAVTAPTQATAAPVADDSVQVTIDSFTPAMPKPGDSVTITGKVINKSAVTFDNPQAIACIDSKRLTTPEQLAAISPEEDEAADDNSSCVRRKVISESTAYLPLGDPLAPQASVPFKLVVHWQEWGLTEQPGVYVVGVAFRGNPSDRQSERATAGQARTLMPVISKTAMPRRVNTALAIPLRHRPTLLADHLFLNDSLAESMAPTGQLGKLLELGKKQTVTWLVDPGMIDEAVTIAGSDYKIATGTGRSKPGTGRAVVKAWLDAFNETRKRNPVVLLPYADADIASLVAAGKAAEGLVNNARSMSAQYPLGLPEPANPSGLWLEGGEVSAKTLTGGAFGFAGQRGDEVNLLSSSGWAPSERSKLLTSPVVHVLTPAGPPKSVRAVIADSDLLAGGPDPATATQPLQLRQRFVAQTSLLAGAGRGPASVVVVPPDSWKDDPRPIAAVQQAMTAPWITAVGINQITDSNPRPVAAPAAPADAPGLSDDQLDKIKDLNQSAKTYQELLSTAGEIPADMKQALVRSTSRQWEASPEDAGRFVDYQRKAVSTLLKQVRLVRNNTKGHQEAIKVNLSGSKGSFPLTVENGLDVSIRVKLVVTSTGNRNDLRIETLSTKILPAGQKGTFQVKASAEQNGLINAKAQLVTAGGDPVGDPQPLLIEAAQYGSVGWILVGAAVALLFGTSIVRIYRRVRSERRNPTEPEPEADALHPEPLPTEDLTPGPEGDETPEVPAPAASDRSELESLKEGVGTKDG
ncbi:hypothetical protein [Kribbella sp. NPDC023855]|uniref:hypothetical protein n=1 Tax=Kribbella sp. NPDC023855 TaxID=3154698 RepID=UPI0033E6C946